MSAETQITLPVGSAHGNQVPTSIHECHLFPIYWGGRKDQRKPMLKDHLHVAVIGFGAKNKLVIFRNIDVIEQKHRPIDNSNHKPLTTVG